MKNILNTITPTRVAIGVAGSVYVLGSYIGVWGPIATFWRVKANHDMNSLQKKVVANPHLVIDDLSDDELMTLCGVNRSHRKTRGNKLFAEAQILVWREQEARRLDAQRGAIDFKMSLLGASIADQNEWEAYFESISRLDLPREEKELIANATWHIVRHHGAEPTKFSTFHLDDTEEGRPKYEEMLAFIDRRIAEAPIQD